VKRSPPRGRSSTEAKWPRKENGWKLRCISPDARAFKPMQAGLSRLFEGYDMYLVWSEWGGALLLLLLVVDDDGDDDGGVL